MTLDVKCNNQSRRGYQFIDCNAFLPGFFLVLSAVYAFSRVIDKKTNLCAINGNHLLHNIPMMIIYGIFRTKKGVLGSKKVSQSRTSSKF